MDSDTNQTFENNGTTPPTSDPVEGNEKEIDNQSDEVSQDQDVPEAKESSEVLKIQKEYEEKMKAFENERAEFEKQKMEFQCHAILQDEGLPVDVFDEILPHCEVEEYKNKVRKIVSFVMDVVDANVFSTSSFIKRQEDKARFLEEEKMRAEEKLEKERSKGFTYEDLYRKPKKNY